MIPDGRERKSLIPTTSQQQQFSYQNPAYQSGFFQNANFPEISRKILRFIKPRKNRERAVFKNGDCNIYHSRKIAKLGYRYLHDIFTSLVDIQWRWTLVIFALAYFVSWLFFALIWWLIMFTHGDLEDENLPQNQAESSWTPCVLNIHNFTSCYLFSIETQYTIGYGVRTTTEECPQAIFIMSMQAIIGMTIDAFFIGIVFAKMTRPKLRTQTLLFSRNAVVGLHEGNLCIMFRVGDMRKNPLIGASIRAQLIKSKQTKEGEAIENYRTELDLTVDGGDNSIFFLWPMTVVHKIDEESPLYHLSSTEMLQDKLEILIVLEATVESTGQSIQARSSYVSSEILWGYKFQPVVDQGNEDAYDINYSKFDDVYPVDTPLVSAAELDAFRKAQEEPEPLKLPPPPLLTTFDDDNDNENEDQGATSPPPPRPRSRSIPRNTRPSYGGYGEEPIPHMTSSYV